MFHPVGKLENSLQTNAAQISSSLHTPLRRPAGAYQTDPSEVVIYTQNTTTGNIRMGRVCDECEDDQRGGGRVGKK